MRSPFKRGHARIRFRHLYWATAGQTLPCLANIVSTLFFWVLCVLLYLQFHSFRLLVVFLIFLRPPTLYATDRQQVFTVLPLSREERTRFHWGHRMFVVPAIAFGFFLPLLELGTHWLTEVDLASLLPKVLWEAALLYVFSFSMVAGILLFQGSREGHWLWSSLPRVPAWIKVMLLGLLPFVVNILAGHWIDSGGTGLHQAIYLLWGGCYIWLARSVFQTPYLLSTGQGQESDAILDSAPPRVVPVFPARKHRYAEIVEQWKSTTLKSLWGGLILLCVAYVAFWLKARTNYDFWMMIALIIGVGVLTVFFTPFLRAFSLREYRSLPMTGRQYVALWMTYYAAGGACHALLGCTLGMLIFSPHALPVKPWSILLWFVPLTVANLILLCGHARMRIKLFPALTAYGVGIALWWAGLEPVIRSGLIAGVLPTGILATGFALEEYTVNRDRAAYSRTSDLELGIDALLTGDLETEEP